MLSEPLLPTRGTSSQLNLPGALFTAFHPNLEAMGPSPTAWGKRLRAPSDSRSDSRFTITGLEGSCEIGTEKMGYPKNLLQEELFSSATTLGPTDKRLTGVFDATPVNPPRNVEGLWDLVSQYSVAAAYGCINFICIIPTLVAYTHIVFAAPIFSVNYLPYLLKTVMLSSVVHQGTFTALSSMGFAVGQVQDVGLIFLAAIVKDIVRRFEVEGKVFPAKTAAFSAKEEDSAAAVVATSLWACSIATGLTGFVVFAVGRRKLVDLVNLIPLPVIAGYLAYIGYFCFAAGLTISTGETIGGPDTLICLFTQNSMDTVVNEILPKLAAMFLLLALLILVHFKQNNPFAMPGLLLILPALIVFSAQQYYRAPNIQEGFVGLRKNGWLPEPPKVSQNYRILVHSLENLKELLLSENVYYFFRISFGVLLSTSSSLLRSLGGSSFLLSF